MREDTHSRTHIRSPRPCGVARCPVRCVIQARTESATKSVESSSPTSYRAGDGHDPSPSTTSTPRSAAWQWPRCCCLTPSRSNGSPCRPPRDPNRPRAPDRRRAAARIRTWRSRSPGSGPHSGDAGDAREIIRCSLAPRNRRHPQPETVPIVLAIRIGGWAMTDQHHDAPCRRSLSTETRNGPSG